MSFATQTLITSTEIVKSLKKVRTILTLSRRMRPFSILLCLAPDNFTCQCEQLGQGKTGARVESVVA